MIITATQKEIPVAPRKIMLLAAAVKKLKPADAVEQLNYLNSAAARPLSKVIRQALANATNNHKLEQTNLKISEIIVNKGQIIRRPVFAGRGRYKTILHTRSHVTVKLETKNVPPAKPAQKAKAATPKVTASKVATKKTVAKPKIKPTKSK